MTSVCVKDSAPLSHLWHHFRGVRALLGRLRRVLTGVANCFVKEIGRLASTRPAGVLCILPSVKPTLLPIRPLDPGSFLPKWILHPFCHSLGCQQSGVADGTDTELAPKDPPHTPLYTHVNAQTHKHMHIYCSDACTRSDMHACAYASAQDTVCTHILV